MINPDGQEWVRPDEACRRWGIPYGTLKVWIARRKVTAHRIDGRLWVLGTSVAEAQHATRGRYLAQRRREVLPSVPSRGMSTGR